LAPGGGPRHAWPKKAARRKTETGNTPQHPKAPDEIERECLPGLVRVLSEEGVDAVRYFLGDMTEASPRDLQELYTGEEPPHPFEGAAQLPVGVALG
jgi:hypothetical protein